MILPKFKEYLLFKKVIPEHQIKFFLFWVSHFLQFSNHAPGQPVDDQSIDAFLVNLSKRREEWQVLQAKEAILLYQQFIYKTDNTRPDDKKPGDSDWKIASDKLIRMLRLKHRSLNTERTYIGWLRDFYRFIRPVRPCSLDDNHIKHYLTYLAVDRRVAKATQNQAFNALLFFFVLCLKKKLDLYAMWFDLERGEGCQPS